MAKGKSKNKKNIKKNKQKKLDIKDIIIKTVLIIIIILLLIHNCAIIKKSGKMHTPNGNMNIIEIICKDNNRCVNKGKNSENTEESKTNSNRDKTNKSTSKSIYSNGEIDSGQNSGKKSDNGSYYPADNSGKDNESTTPSEESTDEDDGRVVVKDSAVIWSDETELKIFNHSYYNFDDKIAPGVSNTYKFIVKNSTDMNLKYDMKFNEENNNHMNMVYKLKKNGTYLINHYVPYNQLNLSGLLLNSRTQDQYDLEWKWDDSDDAKDTAAGVNGAKYKLKITVEAESY